MRVDCYFLRYFRHVVSEKVRYGELCALIMRDKHMAPVVPASSSQSSCGYHWKPGKLPNVVLMMARQNEITIMEPCMNIPCFACLYGIQSSLLFNWKVKYQENSIIAIATRGDVVLVWAGWQFRRLWRFVWCWGRWKSSSVVGCRTNRCNGLYYPWNVEVHQRTESGIGMTTVSNSQSNGIADWFVKTMKEEYSAFMHNN